MKRPYDTAVMSFAFHSHLSFPLLKGFIPEPSELGAKNSILTACLLQLTDTCVSRLKTNVGTLRVLEKILLEKSTS